MSQSGPASAEQRYQALVGDARRKLGVLANPAIDERTWNKTAESIEGCLLEMMDLHKQMAEAHGEGGDGEGQNQS